MPDALRKWSEIENKLVSGETRLFVFDFDGTLSDIVKDPDRAILADDEKKLLTRIANKEGTMVSVLSGRSLEDLKSRVDVPNIVYGGNHGLELQGEGWTFLHPAAARIPGVMGRIYWALQAAFENFRGVYVENKKLTLSVHFRNVAKSGLERFGDVFRKTMRPFLKEQPVVVRTGKMVCEIRPRGRWGKGAAVRFLKGRSGKDAAFFMGDDQTDEDVFGSLTKRDVGLRVGAVGKTKAQYEVESRKDVKKILKKLTEVAS